MKRKISLALFAIAALSTFSCSYFADYLKDPLIGTWKVVYATQIGEHAGETEIITFTDQGTFSIDQSWASGKTASWTGSYEKSMDEVYITFNYKTRNGSSYSYANTNTYSINDDGKLWICWNDANDISSYYTKQ